MADRRPKSKLSQKVPHVNLTICDEKKELLVTEEQKIRSTKLDLSKTLGPNVSQKSVNPPHKKSRIRKKKTHQARVKSTDTTSARPASA